MKITAVLFVDEIEKSLPFWIDRLGFDKTIQVPEGSRLGFVILQHGAGEVMLQTFESLRKDVPSMEARPGEWRTSLYVEVDDFDDIVKRLQGAEITMPVRTTFYGMKEIAAREPGGHSVTFAARA